MKRIMLISGIALLAAGAQAAEIHEAVKAGNLEKVREIIYSNRRRYVNVVDTTNEDGLQPIHIAAKEGNLEMLKSLVLDFDANIYALTRDGLSPEEIAKQHGHTEIVTSINTMELHSALATGDTKQAKSILNTHPDTATNEVGGRKAIHFAAEYNRPDMIDMLLEQNVDVNAQTKRTKETPLHLTTSRDITATLTRNNADPNIRDVRKRTALHAAAREAANFKVGQYLIQAGAEVNAQDHTGSTALHYAAGYGKDELVKVLIDSDADVNIKDHFGNTPLHYASTTRSIEMLVNAGANINAQDKHEATPLHEAASDADLALVRALINKGAKLDIKNKDGETPLEVAQKRKQLYKQYGASQDMIQAIEKTIEVLKEAKSSK